MNVLTGSLSVKLPGLISILDGTGHHGGVSSSPPTCAHHRGFLLPADTPPLPDSRTRRHVHRDADGEPGGLRGPGCCDTEATEEAETGGPVPAQRLSGPAASGWTEEARDIQTGGARHSAGL